MVARAVADTSRDVSEVIDVDGQHRRRPAPQVGASESPFDELDDEAAVWESGERIVMGVEDQLVLRMAAIGDVATDHNRAGDRTRLIQEWMTVNRHIASRTRRPHEHDLLVAHGLATQAPAHRIRTR